MRAPRFVTHNRWGIQRGPNGYWGWRCRCGARTPYVWKFSTTAIGGWDKHLEDHIIDEIDHNR